MSEVQSGMSGASQPRVLIVPPERHPDAPDWSTDDALRLVQRAGEREPEQDRDLPGVEFPQRVPDLLVVDELRELGG